MRDCEKAESILYMALAVYEKTNGPDSEEVASILTQLVRVYKTSFSHAKVRSVLTRKLCIIQNLFGEEHPRIATILNQLGETCEAQADYIVAEQLYKRAISLFDRTQQETPELVCCLRNLSALYLRADKLRKARAMTKTNLELCEKLYGMHHHQTAMVRANYGALLKRLGRRHEAIRNLKLALTSCKKAKRKDHSLKADILDLLSEIYWDMGKPDITKRFRKSSDASRSDNARMQ